MTKSVRHYCEVCGTQMLYSPVGNETEFYYSGFGGDGVYIPNGPAYDKKTGRRLLLEKWVCPNTTPARVLFWKYEQEHPATFGETVEAPIN